MGDTFAEQLERVKAEFNEMFGQIETHHQVAIMESAGSMLRELIDSLKTKADAGGEPPPPAPPPEPES